MSSSRGSLGVAGLCAGPALAEGRVALTARRARLPVGRLFGIDRFEANSAARAIHEYLRPIAEQAPPFAQIRGARMWDDNQQPRARLTQDRFDRRAAGFRR